MDRLDAMAVFVAVADLRGFAPAARRLSLSPSAVTRLVAGLEDRLGARLLQRTTRSVTLTDAGARFLVRAQSILAEVAEAEAAAQAERAAPTGRFVVAAPSMFGRLHVAPQLCAFLMRHPAVTGELVLGDRFVNLVDDGVDVAVRIGFLDDSTLVARPVGATRRVVVAAPDYLARHGKLRTPDDLARHAVIHSSALAVAPEWRFVRDGVEQRIAIAPRFATNSPDAAIGHAELGAGVTMALAYQVIDKVRAGRLKVVLPGFEPPPLPIQVVYPTSRLLSAKVRVFLEQVAACDWRFVAL
ncbi:MAG: LysR family transcriptional regulator [Deltaproteobacteria bacterium]|nr:LysR family transcriptional regulator [Deltaproteobacteria bacterium]